VRRRRRRRTLRLTIRYLRDKLGSFFLFNGHLFHRVSYSIISTNLFGVFLVLGRFDAAGLEMATSSLCWRNVPSGSAWEPSLARQGRSPLMPITAPKRPRNLGRRAPRCQGRNGPGPAPRAAWLFSADGGRTTNCWRQVVLTCSGRVCGHASFLRGVGRIDNHGWTDGLPGGDGDEGNRTAIFCLVGFP
jgi:hypothetical protein